jgi:hypothetical protein
MSARSLVACLVFVPSVATAGILVDHPTLRLAPSTDVSVSAASATVGSVVLESCNGDAQKVPIRRSLDLLRGADLHLPSGSWCGILAVLDSPLTIAGTRADGTSFVVSIDARTLWFSAPEVAEVKGGHANFDLSVGGAGWLSTGSLATHQALAPELRPTLSPLVLSAEEDSQAAPRY